MRMESGGDAIEHEAVRETESDAIDIETAHARATGGEMRTEATDVGTDPGAVNTSDEKTVPSEDGSMAQMTDDQGRARGIADVIERLGAGLHMREAKDGEIKTPL